MDSLRKSFKSHSSYQQIGKTRHEEQPILMQQEDCMRSMETGNRREIVVTVDNGENRQENPSENRNGRDVELVEPSNKIWRESSYDFWKEHDESMPENSNQGFAFRQPVDDPPSKLIGQFLHKQKASGEMSLDMDLEMDELRFESETNHLSPVMENPQVSPRELKVSFQHSDSYKVEIAEPVMAETRRRFSSKDSSSDDEDEEENGNRKGGGSGSSGQVLKCSSRSSSIPRHSGLLRTKTKSRLIDPPPPALQQQSRRLDEEERRSQTVRSQTMKSQNMMKSGQLKSGVLSRIGGFDEDDEDPFFDEDLPGEFKEEKLGAATVLQWVSLFIILAAFICSLTVPIIVKQTVWNLHLWKWLVLVLVLICGRLVSGWGIKLVVFFIERNFLLRKKVLYFVYGVRKAVQNCLWLGLVLIAWNCIFDKKVERETNSRTLKYVTKVLVCLLVGTLIWLVKTLFVKVLASSFHVSTYFDRIQESLFNQFVIEALSGPAFVELQQLREEEEKVMDEVRKFQNAGANIPIDIRAAARASGMSASSISSKNSKVNWTGIQRSGRIGKSFRVTGGTSGRKDYSKQQDDGITVDHLHKLNQSNVSAWNMKRLMNIVRYGVLSTLDETIADAKTEDAAMQIRSEYEAKAAAKKIFINVAKPGCKYIYLVDLMRFMGEDEAIKAMNLFEGANETNRVSRRALKNWVVNAFRERKALSLTLNDTKTAVNKLHQMVNIVVGIIIVVIWLLILGIATTHFLVFISSQVLLVVFIFGNTCKTTFEAIIFLFAMHPFDVGDRCEINGVQMIVEEMNILTTIFLRYDNLKITYPNSVLATLPISNFYRSPDMGDAIDFAVNVATPLEKIAIMKERIKGYIENKTDHWYPTPMVVIRDVEDMNRLKISVWPQHRFNHQDMGERWVRRAYLVEEMIKIFRELDIEYRLLPLDVNLRNMPPLSSTRLPSTWVS